MQSRRTAQESKGRRHESAQASLNQSCIDILVNMGSSGVAVPASGSGASVVPAPSTINLLANFELGTFMVGRSVYLRCMVMTGINLDVKPIADSYRHFCQAPPPLSHSLLGSRNSGSRSCLQLWRHRAVLRRSCPVPRKFRKPWFLWCHSSTTIAETLRDFRLCQGASSKRAFYITYLPQQG